MLIEGLEKKPYVVALYGAAGIGKSTLANGANRAVFLDVEDALHRIGHLFYFFSVLLKTFY